MVNILKGGDITRLPTIASAQTTDLVPISRSGVAYAATVAQIEAIGGGDVVGPASSTDTAFARFDGITGILLQDSQTTENASGEVTFAGVISTPEVIEWKRFVGINNIIVTTEGTWTPTRLSAGLVVYRRALGAGNGVVMIDLAEPMREETARGFKLNSINYYYQIGSSTLNTHTASVLSVIYDGGTVPTGTPVPATGTSLATALSIGSEVDGSEITITTPAYFNPTLEETGLYRLEVSYDAQAGTVYDIVGVGLNFTRNDSSVIA